MVKAGEKLNTIHILFVPPSGGYGQNLTNLTGFIIIIIDICSKFVAKSGVIFNGQASEVAMCCSVAECRLFQAGGDSGECLTGYSPFA